MIKWTDLSEYTVEELTALHKSIDTELNKREEEDKRNCIIAMNTLMDKFAKWHNGIAFNNWRKEFNDIYMKEIKDYKNGDKFGRM